MKDRPLACAQAFLTNISSVLPVSRSMDTGKEILRCTIELKVPDSDIDFWPNLFNKIEDACLGGLRTELLRRSSSACVDTN